MNHVTNQITELMPDFEASVYDGIALRGYDAADPELTPAKISWLRRIVARDQSCKATTLEGHKFLKRKPLGLAVRHEVHKATINETKWGHHFLSFPKGSAHELNEDDILVDPTYLQFATTSEARAKLPLIYVGTRGDMINQMHDPGFTERPEFHVLYSRTTLAPTHPD